VPERRSRRSRGITRRSPREILVALLQALRVKPLAGFFADNKAAAYGLLLVLTAAGATYGRSLWSGVRHLALENELAPDDALDEYPGPRRQLARAEERSGRGLEEEDDDEDDDEDTATEVMGDEGGRSVLPSRANDASTVDGARGGAHDRSRGDEDEEEAERREDAEADEDDDNEDDAAAPARIGRSASRSGGMQAVPAAIGRRVRRSASAARVRLRPNRPAEAEAMAVARRRRRAAEAEARLEAGGTPDLVARAGSVGLRSPSSGPVARAVTTAAPAAGLHRRHHTDAVDGLESPNPAMDVSASGSELVAATDPVSRSESRSAGLAELGPSGVRFLLELQATTAGLDVDVLLALRHSLKAIRLAPGEVLFRRGGDADEGLYIVVSGALEVVDEDATAVAEEATARRAGEAVAPVGTTPLPAAVTGSPSGVDEAASRAAVAAAWHLPSDATGRAIAAAIAAPGVEAHRRLLLHEAMPWGGYSAGDGSRRRRDGKRGGERPSAGARLAETVEEVWLRRRRRAEAAKREGVLATFRRAQMLGENALLAGHGETRAATVRATPSRRPGPDGSQPGTTVLRLSRQAFNDAVASFPHAAASFVLATTARQWRVAHLSLVDFLRLPEAVALEREPRIRPDRSRSAAGVRSWMKRADAAAWAMLLCAGQELDDDRLAARAGQAFEQLQHGAAWEVAAGLAAPGSMTMSGEEHWRASGCDSPLESGGGSRLFTAHLEEPQTGSAAGREPRADGTGAGWVADFVGTSSAGNAASGAAGPPHARPGGKSPWAKRWGAEQGSPLDEIAFRIAGSNAAGQMGRGASFLGGTAGGKPAATGPPDPLAELGRWRKSAALLPEIPDCGDDGHADKACDIAEAAAIVVTLKPGDVLYREGADGRSPSDEPAAATVGGGDEAGGASFRAGACYVLLSGRAASLTALPDADGESALRTAARGGARAQGPSRLRGERRASYGCGQASAGEFLPSSHRVIRHVLPGDIVGGVACVCEVPHRETVVAVAESTFAVFPRRLLEQAAAAPPSGRPADIQEQDDDDDDDDDDYGGSPSAVESLGLDAMGDDDNDATPSPARARAPAPPPLSPAHDEDDTGRLDPRTHAVVVSLLLRCAKLLRPLLRLFFSMGLKRSWRHAGALLFRAGEPCDRGMYLVVSGRVRVHEGSADDGAGSEGRRGGKPGGSRRRRRRDETFDDAPTGFGRAVHEASRGATVGELSVLSGRATRESTAVCVRDTELVAISRAALSRILASHPGVVTRFSRALAQRQLRLREALSLSSTGGVPTSSMPFHLHSSLSGPAPGPLSHMPSAGAVGTADAEGRGSGCVAVLPAGRGGRPLRQFGTWLSRELAAVANGPTRCIGAGDVDAALGGGTTSRMTRILERARVAAWLSRQEEVHSFVVLVADAGTTAWTRLVAQHADVVMLLGRGVAGAREATDAAQIGEVEADAVYVLSGADGESAQARGRRSRQGRDNGPAAAAAAAATTAVGEAIEAIAGAAEDLTRRAGNVIADAAGRPRAPDGMDGGGLLRMRDDAPPSTDRVCAAAGSSGLPGPPPHGSVVRGVRTLARIELVLLWPPGTRIPEQTRKWLRPRQLAAHHHAREEDAPWLRPAGAATTTGSVVSESAGSASSRGAPSVPSVGRSFASTPGGPAPGSSGVARIARFLSGRGVGVVMGGGGARGLAHIGVLRALRGRGVPVDFVAGTSQGAFMAASWAATLDLDGATAAANTLSDRVGSMWVLLQGLTLPLISYFDGRMFSEVIQDALGPATQVEDLWLPYFCVTTNITAARMDIHQTGPLWRACRASMTVLGLLPPILDHSRRHLLADGGYLDNLAVGVMAALAPPAGLRAIIAIDVENKESGRPLENVEDYGEGLSGWWLLGRWALAALGIGPPVRIPSMSHVSLNLSYISHSIRIRQLLSSASKLAGRTGPIGNGESASVVAVGPRLGPCSALVYIRPDVGHYGLLDYDKLTEIAARGRLETDAVLSTWLEQTGESACQFVTSMIEPAPAASVQPRP